MDISLGLGPRITPYEASVNSDWTSAMNRMAHLKGNCCSRVLHKDEGAGQSLLSHVDNA
jgi:hypothetical protein